MGDSAEHADLATLLEYIAEIPGIERIRYTTSHPKEMTPRLIAALRQASSKLVSHLHLPVQSGSDRVLAAMKRGYTALEYKSIVRKLRAERPGISLTSDFIVGFPGETDADFAQTMRLVEDVELRRRLQLRVQPAPGHAGRRARRPGAAAGEAGAPRGAAGAARRAVPRLQRSDGRHAAARARHRPRRSRTRASSPARTENNRVVNFAGDATLVGTLRRRHDHRGAARTRCAASSPTRLTPNAAAPEARPAHRIALRRFHDEVTTMSHPIQRPVPPIRSRRSRVAGGAWCCRAAPAARPARIEPRRGARRRYRRPTPQDGRRRGGRRRGGGQCRERASAAHRPASVAQAAGAAAAARGRPEAVRRSDQGREGDAGALPRSGRRTTRSGSRSRPSSSIGSTSSRRT